MANTQQLFKQNYQSSDDVARVIAEDINVFALENDIEENIMEQVELCIAELVNNAYEHAYELTDGCPIEVICYLKDDAELVIEISDFGQAMDRSAFKAAVNAEFVVPDPDDEATWTTSGRGFIIIVQLTDSLIYTCEDNKNTFEFHKKLWTQ
jgi:serine/threonine-protein kinase RsbW